MQARPELSNRFKERQIACFEGTGAVHRLGVIHIYLYASNRFRDTPLVLSKACVHQDLPGFTGHRTISG